MKNIYKILIISLFITFFIAEKSYSQDLKYKDIYEVILTGDKEKSYTLLLAYQKQDPDFANTYFQLGIIAHEWAKSYNPFTDYFFTKLFIYNTKLYYNLARHSMKNESKSNYKYYKNVTIPIENKKLQENDINNYIDKQTADIAFYEINVNKIIKYYNKTVENYNFCVNTFKQINTDYSIIKNIYLSEDVDFISNLNKLEVHFDSTLFYFAEYKLAIKEYPIKNYNQNYKLKKIVTYRLDGLTNSNFLDNNIIIWDYKSWVANTSKISKTAISNNKNDIDLTHKKIEQKLTQLSANKYSNDIPTFKVDDKFKFKIGKYDHNSLLVRLFEYQESKVNFLIMLHKKINKPKDTIIYTNKKLAQYYKGITEIKLKADSLNLSFEKEIKPIQVQKYQKYYMQNYNGMKGLKAYSFQQELFLNTMLQTAFANYKNKIKANEKRKNINYKTLNFSNNQIIFTENKIDFDNAQAKIYYAVKYKKAADNSVYFTGYTKTKNNKIESFIGKANSEGKVQFLKLIAKNDSSKSCGFAISIYDKGAFVITTLDNNKSSRKNIISTISDKGKIINEKEINISSTPRYMAYDEINNTMIMSFKGDRFIENININQTQITINYNLATQEPIFVSNTVLKGTLCDIVKMDSNIFVFNNFKTYLTDEYDEITAKAQTNVFLNIINSKGKIIQQKNYFNTKSFYANSAIKINSNTINLIGYYNKKAALLQETDKAKFHYSIINSKGKETFNNWHN